MPSTTAVNDVILQPYLMAQDSDESQRQLLILLAEHAEARMRGIIKSRLRSYLGGQEHAAEFEDVYSEAKTRLLTYLRDLKTGKRNTPCEDFTGYVAAIAHNAFHDYFREAHPARSRFHKRFAICFELTRFSHYGNLRTRRKASGYAAFIVGEVGRARLFRLPGYIANQEVRSREKRPFSFGHSFSKNWSRVVFFSTRSR
jgi:hypothetical protein